MGKCPTLDGNVFIGAIKRAGAAARALLMRSYALISACRTARAIDSVFAPDPLAVLSPRRAWQPATLHRRPSFIPAGAQGDQGPACSRYLPADDCVRV